MMLQLKPEAKNSYLCLPNMAFFGSGVYVRRKKKAFMFNKKDSCVVKGCGWGAFISRY
jgi:hypothetical protein